MSKLVKAPFCTVFVRRGLNEEHPKTVMTHEVVLLAAVHGDDAIRVADVQPGGNRTVDPEAEYERMAALYGTPKGDDTPYVTAIYGMRMGKQFQKTVGKKLSKFIAVPDNVTVEAEKAPEKEKEEDPDPVSKTGSDKLVSKNACIEFLEGASVPDIDKKLSADEMREFTMATAIQIAGALEISVDSDAGLADVIAAIEAVTGE